MLACICTCACVCMSMRGCGVRMCVFVYAGKRVRVYTDVRVCEQL